MNWGNGAAMRWTVGLAWLVLATAAPSAGFADEHENAAGEKGEDADAHPKQTGGGKAHEPEHKPDLFHHTRDNTYFELPEFLGGATAELPAIWIGGYRFQITKLMVLQVVVGLLMLFVFGGLASRIRHGQPPRGAFWNFWEVIALFLRDNVVRPTIGTGHHDHGDEGHGGSHHGHGHADAAEAAHAHGGAETAGHPADKYLPYVWTVFFWVLFSNLLGAVPFLGSPTQHITVTGVLAACTFAMVLISGSRELGPVQFWVRLVPKMDVPAVMELPLFLLIWLIEILGLVVKHGVLAVRLFANILAGHTVIAVFLGFIAAAAAPDFPGGGVLYWLVVPSSIFGQVAIGLLELMVAFIQAYIFAFLSTLFIATAVHPH